MAMEGDTSSVLLKKKTIETRAMCNNAQHDVILMYEGAPLQ